MHFLPLAPDFLAVISENWNKVKQKTNEIFLGARISFLAGISPLAPPHLVTALGQRKLVGLMSQWGQLLVGLVSKVGQLDKSFDSRAFFFFFFFFKSKEKIGFQTKFLKKNSPTFYESNLCAFVLSLIHFYYI